MATGAVSCQATAVNKARPLILQPRRYRETRFPHQGCPAGNAIECPTFATLFGALELEQTSPICVSAVTSSPPAPSSSGHEVASGDAGCTRAQHFVVVGFLRLFRPAISTVPCRSRQRACSSRTARSIPHG